MNERRKHGMLLLGETVYYCIVLLLLLIHAFSVSKRYTRLDTDSPTII